MLRGTGESPVATWAVVAVVIPITPPFRQSTRWLWRYDTTEVVPFQNRCKTQGMTEVRAFRDRGACAPDRRVACRYVELRGCIFLSMLTSGDQCLVSCFWFQVSLPAVTHPVAQCATRMGQPGFRVSSFGFLVSRTFQIKRDTVSPLGMGRRP